MKTRRFFVIAFLIVFVTACNFPLISDEDSWGVDSVTITPQSGSGEFNGVVTGNVNYGESILSCYVSVKNGGSEIVYRKAFKASPHRILLIYDTYPFYETFSFVYTQPGAHSLVCWLDEKTASAWSVDFIVVENTATPTFTPIPPITVLTLDGTFLLDESEIQCGDGRRYPNPASAIPGTVELTIDASAGTASATIEGTSGDVAQKDCEGTAYNLRYTIDRSTISGTFNLSTGELNLSGEVKYGFLNSCYSAYGSSCTAGGLSDLTMNMIMNGTVDLAKRSAFGKIKGGLNPEWGDWQAK